MESAVVVAKETALSAQTTPLHDPNFEPLTNEECKHIGVYACGLRKRYADGKLAVKDLSIALVEGQITCLLGHNGAGN